MTTQTSHGTPLMTIEFTHKDEPLREPLIRYWYHVPRENDHVILNEGEDNFMSGRVHEVVWHDGNDVELILR